MIKIIFIGALLTIISCSINSNVNSFYPIQINATEKESYIHIKDATLITKNNEIENWPYKNINCIKCVSSEKNQFTPKGPEKRILIYNAENKLVAFAIESHFETIKFHDFIVNHDSIGRIEICNSKLCKFLPLKMKQMFDNCSVIVTDSQYEKERIEVGDSGNIFTQIAGSCK